MGTETQFRTFQTVKSYEEALARHGQWCRWISVIVCPCVTQNTGQADISCTLCQGRGKIFKNPGPFNVEQEMALTDQIGRIYVKNTPILSGTVSVWKGETLLSLGSQPSDGSYIQMDTPYPRTYKRLKVDYTFSPIIEVTDEDSTVYDETNFVLRVVDAQFLDKGKTYEGSIDGVTRVYNVDKDETYTVTSFQKEYIYLSAMGTWASGDVLEVDYTYLQPFDFLLHSISERRRYESAYVLDSADATLVAPYYCQVSPHDLITALSNELLGYAIIDPTHSQGNDEVRDYFDLSKIIAILDMSGIEYDPVAGDVELFGRNEIKWNVTKPTVKYTVHFQYHPTFTALMTYDTARTSENKSFVNRINVMLRDKINEVTF